MADKRMAREEAIRVAEVVYQTSEPAVIELLMLATHPDRVASYRALRALQWFDVGGELPAEARTAAPSSSAVEAALEAIKYVLYGHERGARTKAAKAFGTITRTLGRTA